MLRYSWKLLWFTCKAKRFFEDACTAKFGSVVSVALVCYRWRYDRDVEYSGNIDRSRGEAYWKSLHPRASAVFWLGGSMPPCRLSEENFENLTTKWCILKYIWINMWTAYRRCLHLPSPPPQPVQKTALFCMFSLLIFHPFSRVGQLTPFAPMCGRPWLHRQRHYEKHTGLQNSVFVSCNVLVYLI